MKDTLDQFYTFTGLRANSSKSCLFFAGVEEGLSISIGQSFQFSTGSLPMKYLGVPLITTRLTQGDCVELVNKISSRILSWTSRFLSFAGRVQLIQSVLAGIQNFWAGMFILPKSVLKQVERLMRRFLWTGGIEKAHGAKVSWDNVCKPKDEGGLGLKRLPLLNHILNFKHIWALLSPQNHSLWAQWIYTYMLKNKSLWVVKPHAQSSWYWRKLLKLRDTVRPMIRHKIGNGYGTFLWYDNWHPLGPLLDRFGPRVTYDAALNLNARVSDVINGGRWDWPIANTFELMEIREQMSNLPAPSTSNDTVIWLPSPNGRFSAAYQGPFEDF